MRKPNPLLPFLAVLTIALVALPASAETFTLKLKNGTSFESRYRPQEATWDADTVLVMTDMGHWIGIPRRQVQEVEVETEARGFGKVIDTTTIDLGIAPNDLPPPDQADQQDTLQQLQNLIQGQERSYDVPQFVSPGEAGSGGLPVGFGSGLGGGGTTLFPVPQGGGGGN